MLSNPGPLRTAIDLVGLLMVIANWLDLPPFVSSTRFHESISLFIRKVAITMKLDGYPFGKISALGAETRVRP